MQDLVRAVERRVLSQICRAGIQCAIAERSLLVRARQGYWGHLLCSRLAVGAA
jgi:hypothetical protein